MVYQWKAGSHIKANAEKVGKEVEKLRGYKTPEKLLDYAKTHTNSELHSCFEWNNGKAAEKYRLEQARHILRCLIVVKSEFVPKKPKEVKITSYKAYESIETGQGRAYISTPIALQKPEWREQIFQRIRNGIDNLERLGDDYSEMLKNPKKYKESLQKVLEFV